MEGLFSLFVIVFSLKVFILKMFSVSLFLILLVFSSVTFRNYCKMSPFSM